MKLCISLFELIFSAIKEQLLLNGATGKVAFDNNGDRKYPEYDIYNVQESIDGRVQQRRKIGEITYLQQEVIIII